jgi:hypothetical protein
MRSLLPPLIFSCILSAQTSDDVNARIRKEEADHSQVMHTEHMLTDRYGPRMTGSPNHEAAAKWVASQLTEWGFKNVHLEPWDFGRAGWLNERASGFIVAPVKQNLKFEVVAWTPSTKGAVTAPVVQLPALPEGPPLANAGGGQGGGRGGRGGLPGAAPTPRLPTKEQMNEWLVANKDKIRGKMVLIGKAAVVPVTFTPLAQRRPDDEIRQQYDPDNPNAGRGFGRGGAPQDDPSRLTTADVDKMLGEWMLANGAVMRIQDSAMERGIIRVVQHRAYDPSKTVPHVMLRNEDYGRIERLLGDGETVQLEFNIINHDYPEGKTSFNVVGEIPGSDKADEIVMLGGHLDSWHSATGATDNAAGSAIMLEAARLIQALGLKPRRTIRVALWSGEEEGLLGSLAYVKQHFGTAEDPKPEFAKLDCYLNIDSGTGRPRGASIFGPPEAAAIMRRAIEPFTDLGIAGAMPTSSRVTAGTDSTSFNNAGLPGIGFQQDPIEYNTVTHHTNLDTYERIIPADMTTAATVIAGSLWYVASLDRMVPRFAKDQMPAPVAPR